YVAERLLRRAGRRAVIVGEVEMGDAEVEGAAADGAPGPVRRILAEIVPQPERQRRQLQAGAAAAVVAHRVVAVVGGCPAHVVVLRSGCVVPSLAVSPARAIARGLISRRNPTARDARPCRRRAR